MNDSKSAPAPNIPQLFASWHRAWGSHIRGVHVENNTFNVALTALFPSGYGNDKTPFETFERGLYGGYAEFVVENGKVIGMGLNDYGMESKKGKEVGVQEGAMAWFEKI